jgi:hypothetical protein
MALHIEVSGSMRLGASPADAFMFLTPEGEKRWVVGWEPEYLHPADGALQQGLTFRTQHGGEETLWLVARLNGPKEVDYVRVTPASRMGIVSVRVSAAGVAASDVTVTYRLTSLSPAADATVDAFGRAFPEMLAMWERSINTVLAETGSGGAS